MSGAFPTRAESPVHHASCSSPSAGAVFAGIASHAGCSGMCPGPAGWLSPGRKGPGACGFSRSGPIRSSAWRSPSGAGHHQPGTTTQGVCLSASDRPLAPSQQLDAGRPVTSLVGQRCFCPLRQSKTDGAFGQQGNWCFSCRDILSSRQGTTEAHQKPLDQRRPRKGHR